jgi:single-strand DNA-binding protein
MKGAAVGKLVSEPELAFTQDGKPWLKARFGIESRAKRNGEWTTEMIWCDLRIFGPLAEHVGTHAEKGTRLTVQGTLQADPWTTKDGEKREGLTLIADSVGLDLTFGLEPASRTATGREPF